MNAGITLKDLLSFGSIGATIVFGSMWLGALDESVRTLKSSTVTAERIASLETEVREFKQTNKELRESVNVLIREIRRGPNN